LKKHRKANKLKTKTKQKLGKCFSEIIALTGRTKLSNTNYHGVSHKFLQKCNISAKLL